VTDERRRDPRAVFLLVGSAVGAALSFSFALAFLRYGASIALDLQQTRILAASLTLTGALSLPAFYYGIRSLQSKGVPDIGTRALGIPELLLLLSAWLGSLWGTRFPPAGSVGEWALPMFHVLGIGVPVFILIRLVAGGLGGGSARRMWGVLTTGMWLGTGLAALVEALLCILALIGVAAYLVAHPGQVAVIQGLARELAGTPALPIALDVLRPWLERPEILLSALAIFAALTPVIEEIAKSVAAWTVVDRLQAPGDGFVAGALAGAGFGFLEGLLASASPDVYSTGTLITRAGSSMMHIAAGAWAGSGIAGFQRTRAARHLVRGYLAAISTHGLWNASIVLLGFGSLHFVSGADASNFVALGLVGLGGSILAALCVGTPIALMIANRRLRTELSSRPTVSALEAHLASQPSGSPPGGKGISR